MTDLIRVLKRGADGARWSFCFLLSFLFLLLSPGLCKSDKSVSLEKPWRVSLPQELQCHSGQVCLLWRFLVMLLPLLRSVPAGCLLPVCLSPPSSLHSPEDTRGGIKLPFNVFGKLAVLKRYFV